MEDSQKPFGRRRFIKGLLAAGAQARSLPPHPSAGVETEVPRVTEAGIDFTKNSQALFPIISGNQTYTLLSDTDHGNLAYPKMLVDASFGEMAERAGIKHVCVEMGHTKDGIFRDIWNGKIKKYSDYNLLGGDPDREDLFVMAALNAKKHGIQFHAVDTISSSPEGEYYRENISEVIQTPKMKDFNGSLDRLHDWLKKGMAQPGFKEEYERRLRVINERYHNTDTVALIKAATNGEKSIVFYGSGHHTASCGQAQLLGDSKTVQLFSNKQEMDWYYNTNTDPLVTKAFPVDFSTPPNAVLLMSSNQIIAPPADKIKKLQTTAAAFPAENNCPVPARKLQSITFSAP